MTFTLHVGIARSFTRVAMLWYILYYICISRCKYDIYIFDCNYMHIYIYICNVIYALIHWIFRTSVAFIVGSYGVFMTLHDSWGVAARRTNIRNDRGKSAVDLASEWPGHGRRGAQSQGNELVDWGYQLMTRGASP